MRKFAIIGLGTFGESLAKSLTEKGAEVIAIDRNMDRVEAIQDYVSIAVQLDSTEEGALLAQGIDEVDVAVVCIGEDFKSNLLTSVLLKQIGVPQVISRSTGMLETKILKAVGIERVVDPEEEVGERLAYSLMHPALKDIFYLAGNISVAEFKAPRSFVGKTLQELSLRPKYGINLIVIRSQTEKGEQVVMPNAETVIREGDHLMVVGSREAINKVVNLD